MTTENDKNMSRKRKIMQFKVLERRLDRILKEKHENEIVLSNADFKDGKLSFAGYNRLKQECEYIDYSENIEIIIPEKYANNFKETLENMMANETLHIKKDIQVMRFKSIIFLLIGVLWFTLGNVFTLLSYVKEITIVATWVFVWSAIEMWFFDSQKMKKRKYNLLHILSAKMTTENNKKYKQEGINNETQE